MPFKAFAGAGIAFATMAMVSAEAPNAVSPAERGVLVFAQHCAMCHSASLLSPGTMALAQRTPGKASILAERPGGVPAPYVRYVVRTGLRRMPPIARDDVSDADLDAVAAYLAKAKR